MKYVEAHLPYFFANFRWVFHTRSTWHCLKVCWGPIQMFYSNLLVADLKATFSNAITWMAWLLSLQDIDKIPQNLSKHFGKWGSNSQILSVKCPTTFWWCPGIPTVQKSGQPFDMENLSCLQSGWRRISSIHIFFAWGSRAEAWLSRIAQVRWEGTPSTTYPERQQQNWQSEIIL